MKTAIDTHTLRSRDGTELNYYCAGSPNGRTMVLCNGLGGNVVAWRALIDHFAPRFRILSWDYRGLHRSGPAFDAEHYWMLNHVGDLVDLLDHEGVESPVLLGWSMGVQLGLELQRTHPDLAAAIVAIHGTPGEPLKTAFDSRWPERIAKPVFEAMRVFRRNFEPLGVYLARTKRFPAALVWTAQRLGVMAPTLDLDTFRMMADEWVRIDFGIYADIFEKTGKHDAWDLLPSIKTPTLIIAGGHDRFTPLHLSRRMAEEMPDARIHVVPGATHFGLLEYPDEIAGAIDQFLEERLGLPGPQNSSEGAGSPALNR